MKSDDDRELSRVLREWKVPDAPDSLALPRGPRRRSVWWGWLRRDIRVPLPVALVLSILLIWMAATATRDDTPRAPEPATADDLRGFEPVNTVNVRIERSGDAER